MLTNYLLTVAALLAVFALACNRASKNTHEVADDRPDTMRVIASDCAIAAACVAALGVVTLIYGV